MDLAFILSAAEAVEHKKSETPFFIAGGVLVAYALAISVVGFTRPAFPTSAPAARGVMGLGLVLVVAAMAMSIYVSS